MIQNKEFIAGVLILSTASLFFLASCSLFGKKEEKLKVPPDKIVTVEGMETVKGVNQPKGETSHTRNTGAPCEERSPAQCGFGFSETFIRLLPSPLPNGFEKKGGRPYLREQYFL
jgi:hypothetical protein